MGCIGIFMHLYLYNNNKEKEGHEFVSGGAQGRGWRGRKGKGEMIESHLIKQ